MSLLDRKHHLTWRERIVIKLLLIVARIVGGTEMDVVTRTEIESAGRDINLGEWVGDPTSKPS
jgi:hypothetical protein